MALRLVGLTALLIVNALAVYLALDYSFSPRFEEAIRQMDDLSQQINETKELVELR